MILARNKKARSLEFETFGTVFRFLILCDIDQIPIKRTLLKLSLLLRDNLGVRFLLLFGFLFRCHSLNLKKVGNVVFSNG